MESPANPYSTPAANLYSSTSGGSSDTVSPSTIAQLAGTKPWVRFMSVIMCLLSGLMVITCGTLSFAISTGAFKEGPDAAMVTAIMTGTVVYYGVLAFVMLYPALKFWKYASCIANLMTSHSITDLDAALTEQRRYWKFNGVMIIIVICLTVISFIAIVGFAAMKAGSLPR